MVKAKQLPLFADLRLLAAQLADHSNWGKIQKAIRKAALAQSCVTDLAQASDCCSALRQLLVSPRKRGTEERAATESSLLMSAALLYARATEGNGGRGERGSMQITAQLTSDALDDHRLIVKVRNRALAHVYHDEEVDNEIWHQSTLIAVLMPEGWLPAAASKRVQIHKSILDRLQRQIPVAQSIILRAFHTHINNLINLMNSSGIDVAAANASLVDPIAVFGSGEAVKRALAGIPSGKAILID